MGTDIYMFVERKVGQSWRRVSNIKGVEQSHYDENLKQNVVVKRTWELGRNYELFGLLAGVKSNLVNPIVTPRGLPDDLSPGIKRAYNASKDSHTQSYYSLDELLKIKHESSTVSYFLNAEQFKEYKKTEKLEKYKYYIIPPRGAKLISNEKMIRIMNLSSFMEENECITQVDEKISYQEISSYFWDSFVPAMQQVLKDPEKIRCVFWFNC